MGLLLAFFFLQFSIFETYCCHFLILGGIIGILRSVEERIKTFGDEYFTAWMNFLIKNEDGTTNRGEQTNSLMK